MGEVEKDQTSTIGALKFIALVMAIVIPVATIQATQITPIKNWKENHQEVPHVENRAMIRIEEKLDLLSIQQAINLTKIGELVKSVDNLTDELKEHREGSE